MHDRRILGGMMASIVLVSAFLPALALPHAVPSEADGWRPSPVYRPGAEVPVSNVAADEPVQSGSVASAVAQPRKFNEKPNNPKKVPFETNEIDDIQTNQMTDGFWWSNVLSTFIQMFFNGGNPAGPSKSEGLDDDNMAPTSPWAQVLQVGLKILSHFLGGGNAGGDGIDKVDNSSPMQEEAAQAEQTRLNQSHLNSHAPFLKMLGSQGLLAAVLSAVLGSKDPDQVATMAKQAGEFINIVVNLLDALKTSFSHRSIAARSMGKKDTVSEAAVAGISLLKGYVRTYKTSDELCMQKYLCEANRECLSQQEGPSAIYCQLGSYAASVLLQRSTSTPFDLYYEAGRRGRSGEDCQQIYLACNQV